MKGSKALAIFFILICMIGFTCIFLALYAPSFVVDSYRDMSSDFRVDEGPIIYNVELVGCYLAAISIVLALIFIAIGEPEPNRSKKQVAIPELRKNKKQKKTKVKKEKTAKVKKEKTKTRKSLDSRKRSRNKKAALDITVAEVNTAAPKLQEVKKQNPQDYINSLRG